MAHTKKKEPEGREKLLNEFDATVKLLMCRLNHSECMPQNCTLRRLCVFVASKIVMMK